MTLLVLAFSGLVLILTVLLWRQSRVIARLRTDLRRVEAGRSFAAVGTWDWAVDQDELHWSDEVYAMFGFALGAVKPSYALFCSMVHPDDARKVREGEVRCIEGEGTHDTQYRIIRADGSIRWLRETGNIVRDRDGKPIRMIGMVRDVTEDKEREDRILHQAFHDVLTGLPNRAYFRALLNDAIIRARRNRSRLALGFIDLNKFKPINDSLGHAVGDKVLVELAGRLSRGLRDSDHVARLGGDEFVVIIEAISSAAQAETVIAMLHQIIHQPFEIDGNPLHVGASIGVSLYPDDGESGEVLVRLADQAMYEAKKAGDIIRFSAS